MTTTSFVIFILLFSIPIIAIVCWTIVKVVESVFGQSKLGKQEQKMVQERLRLLERENEALQQRTENLEAIIANIDGELLEGLLRLQVMDKAQGDSEKIKQYANHAKKQHENSHLYGFEPFEEIEKSMRVVVNKLLTRINDFIDEKPSRSTRY